jgi:hypothetical protein
MQKQSNRQEIEMVGIVKDVGYIKNEVTEINRKLEADYITRQEFDPIKKVVYGMVSLILIAVVGALVGLVIMR